MTDQTDPRVGKSPRTRSLTEARPVAIVVLITLVLAVAGCGRSPSSGDAPAPESGTAAIGAGPDQPAGDRAGDPAGDDSSGTGTGGSADQGGADEGGTDEGAADQSGPGPGVVLPSPADCVSYSPANLTVKTAGASGWQLLDGSHALMLFDTKSDADNGLKVAHNYTQHCFIGRSNQRADRYRYIHEYWVGKSGLAKTQPSPPDCTGYAPSTLAVDESANGWSLVDPSGPEGVQVLQLFDTERDAERGRLVALDYTELCFVGRGTARPDRARYIAEYWH